MSVHQQIKILHRVQSIVGELQKKYRIYPEAMHELTMVDAALQRLLNYLNELDPTHPQIDRNEVNQFVEAVNVNLVILKAELEKIDYQRLSKAVSGLKILLRYHATKWSLLKFMIAWFVEFFYFI